MTANNLAAPLADLESGDATPEAESLLLQLTGGSTCTTNLTFDRKWYNWSKDK
ncbi:hypothetical protein [Actinocorallia sp. A-T 12471]|uniref:hypothetical protein n=1 Tax=Actinocorallia sp. A-T 12471 TaxID=3089813 RepID=UPI0029D092FC|nr:hypothetical protein [Actinocorallia sp. A-T 12471]MDX6740494.1 hypothetical protein [Actinocorallia sp. A-T 12471]